MIMDFEPIYSAKVNVRGGREGKAFTTDDQMLFKFVMPPVLGGDGGEKGTNPEELFAASLGACLVSTIDSLAKMKGIKTKSLYTSTQVTLGRWSNNGFRLAVHVQIFAKSPEQRILKVLTEDAFEICTYVKAIKGNVELTWQLFSN